MQFRTHSVQPRLLLRRHPTPTNPALPRTCTGSRKNALRLRTDQGRSRDSMLPQNVLCWLQQAACFRSLLLIPLSMLDGFEVVDFPTLDTLSSIPGSAGGFLYVLCWVRNGAQTPFYVGQTRRLRGRMEDYCLAQFQASTDFRVGESVRYLRGTKGYQIVLRYRPSLDFHTSSEVVQPATRSGPVRASRCFAPTLG